MGVRAGGVFLSPARAIEEEAGKDAGGGGEHGRGDAAADRTGDSAGDPVRARGSVGIAWTPAGFDRGTSPGAHTRVGVDCAARAGREPQSERDRSDSGQAATKGGITGGAARHGAAEPGNVCLRPFRYAIRNL